ncbi:hypothetical protein [Asaia krungthepensis]|uniref:Uncharacterized protein n=1 Tax=Asaia krungthepensis NRIC 0535 TaxID=1307925 RepID=A0ABQ0Q6E8_9PROT|nr:hypothetical protein [Asaia krungthepensis]GBQ93577.1 hypothetical protein AA0535_2875 [Asaia krungthepensis NRIC 0535]
MRDDAQPQPELLKASPDGAHAPSRRASHLPGLVVLTGIVISGLAALHYAGGNAPSGTPNLPPVAKDTGSSPAEAPAKSASPHLGASLPVIPADRSLTALAHSGYSKTDQARILAAVKRREVSLVQMPIAEIDGRIGGTVRIDAGGFSQFVTLSENLKAVTLPIFRAGEVTISPAHMIAGNTLATGVLTVYGMYTLPTLGSSELVTLDVVAQ